MIDSYGNIFFVLGRSKEMHTWTEGSHLWSDFGGIPKTYESIEESSAREFIEESLGVLVQMKEVSILTQLLLDKKFVLKIVYENQTFFVVRFQWNPAIVRNFKQQRHVLGAIHKICRCIPLNQSERLVLAKFMWLKGDPRIHHDALSLQCLRVDSKVIESAQNELSKILMTQSVEIKDATPRKCHVINEVEKGWLEKDEIQLFSIPQILQSIEEKYTCRLTGKTVRIKFQFKSILVKIITCLQFSSCQ